MHFGNLMTYFLEWYIQSNWNWGNVDDQVLWYKICLSQSQMGNLCQCFCLAQNLWRLFTFLGYQSWAGSWNLGCMNVDVFSFMLSTFSLIVVVWQFESLHKTKNKKKPWLKMSIHMYSLEASADTLRRAAFPCLAFTCCELRYLLSGNS